MKTQVGVILLLVTVTGCSSVPRSYMPADPIAPSQASHDAWNQIVQAHVRDGQVNYPAIQADARLDGYLAQLNRIDPNGLSTREARLAFWINAYNAFAVKGILDQYSPKTLWGRYRYFIGREYRVGGTTINLYDLERKVLIEQFHEPLMHFAIVCASASCPKLQPWAYESAQLDRQLTHVARAFINDPTKNRFDRARRVAMLSKIFDWFEEDFVAAAGSVPQFLARYVDDAEVARDLRAGLYRLEYLDYDWSLNGPPPHR